MRLEPYGEDLQLSVVEFQFHKGAIRTERLIAPFFWIRWFQFHKGAIRTPCRFFDSLSDRYFNSIKVRLEPYDGIDNDQFMIFQFHKGAIRTALCVRTTKSDRDFNSIKVRLEHSALAALNFSCFYFNSIKVRLELMRLLLLKQISLFQFHKGAIRTL